MKKTSNINDDVKGVFLCSPTNSQMFTNCCEVAICQDEKRCPSCNSLVVGYDASSDHQRGLKRWRYAYKK